MQENQITIQGKFIRKIYHNQQTKFTVSKFRLYELVEKEIIVTGLMSDLPKDVLFDLDGFYVEHEKYGMQFKVLSYRKVLPTDNNSLIRYLSGPLFSGIGTKLATAIVEKFGEDSIKLIKENPDVLDDLQMMTLKKKEAIIKGINNVDDIDESIQFFSTHGLGIRNIAKIQRIYGKDALLLIKENPYRLIEEVDGIGFATADKLAMKMGYELDHPNRLSAIILSSVLDKCLRRGDSYYDYETFLMESNKELSEYEVLVDDLIMDLRKRRLVIVEENRIYHHSQYDAEEGVCSYLSQFPNMKIEEIKDLELSNYLDHIQNHFQIEYDEKQIQAIETFFKQDLMILTGGPGTGKTTVVQGMVSMFRQIFPNYTVALCAPTGRAAKRLSELTDTPAFTIHSLLKWDLETNTFGYNHENPVALDLLVIDEFSMVDPWLFYQLCKAGANIKKIVMIGDEDQLPSVSSGSLLRDLIDSNCFPLVRLEKIFRQKEGSDVITLAHQIKNGQYDILNQSDAKDVLFIDCDPYHINEGVLKLVENAISKGYGIEEIQVLAPKYNGVVGIDRLNHTLQKACNPSDSMKRQIQIGYKTFRENDKILQLKNQPDDDVYNGDIGILEEIHFKNTFDYTRDTLVVNFDGNYVEYTKENFQNITHAYCISIHKSQGSEYPIVIMPMVSEYSFMLQRRLIYTAITRARKSLVIIGEKAYFEKGISIQEKHIRKTTLKERILNHPAFK